MSVSPANSHSCALTLEDQVEASTKFQKLLEAQQEEQKRQDELNTRRALQRRLAGHQDAKHLKFGEMKISEHALFRWNDRARKETGQSLPDFLKELDDAKHFFRLEPNRNGWIVTIQLSPYEGDEKIKLELILNNRDLKARSTILTILRDDDDYDYEESDRNYASAGQIRKDHWLCGPSLQKSKRNKNKKKSNGRRR